MSPPRRALRSLFAVAATVVAGLALARSSDVPVPLHDARSARLRLSWSARPERIEVCRELTAAELAERQAHMRQRVECEGRFASYDLRVVLDDSVYDASIVRGAGLRHDRPQYLLRDFEVMPGARRLRLSLARREASDSASAGVATPAPAADADTGIFAGRARRELEERARRTRAAMPPRLAVDTTLTFAAGRTLIVTFVPEQRALRVLAELEPKRR